MKRDYETLYLYGYALAWANKKFDAEKYLSEATLLDPTDYRAFYSLGYVYRDTGRPAEAKKAWQTVLKLMPHFPEIENRLRSLK